MALGSLPESDYGRRVCESWRTAWSLASNLWGRRYLNPDIFELFPQKADDGVLDDCSVVRKRGISDGSNTGMAASWTEMVGLQWIFPEFAGTYLCRGNSCVQHWRYGDCLSGGADGG